MSGDTGVSRIFLALRHEPENYRVRIAVYGGDGRLLEEHVYDAVKQVYIRGMNVRISRQIGPEPVVLVLEPVGDGARIEERNGILYIVGE